MRGCPFFTFPFFTFVPFLPSGNGGVGVARGGGTNAGLDFGPGAAAINLSEKIEAGGVAGGGVAEIPGHGDSRSIAGFGGRLKTRGHPNSYSGMTPFLRPSK
jgi:hypothetical protein